jgi:hypothetical protein
MAGDVTVRATLTAPTPVVTYTPSTPAGVAFVDVCAMTGVGTALSALDDATVSIPVTGITIPFPLRMYGVDVTPPIAVSTNGWLSLSRTTTTALSGSIPSPTEPNLTIAPLWTDLFSRTPGICYAVLGTAPNRQFVVEWNDEQECCGTMPTTHLTYEAVINEAPMGTNNTIDLVYQRIDGMTRVPVAGIENDDGSIGVTIPGPFTAGRVVRFTPDR